MNKKELKECYFNFLKEFDLIPTDVVVGAGGGLVLMGLRESTSDIDVSVDAEFFNRYREQKDVTINHFYNPKKGLIEVLVSDRHPLVDVHLNSIEEEGVMIDSIWAYSPEYNLKFKKGLNREKDQKDIKALEKYINSHK